MSRDGGGVRPSAGGRAGPGDAQSRPSADVVFKVGGSLLDAGHGSAVVRAVDRAAGRIGALLVGGGGRAADRVRERHRRGALSASGAHWAAVRALDAAALRLAGGCGHDLDLVAVPGPVPRGSGLSVLAPYALLRAEDPLPHTWAVTSDSIAAWCGMRGRARDVVLLKARDAAARAGGSMPRRAAERAARSGLVDDHLPALLAPTGPRCWALNGRHPDRILRWATGDVAAATRLVPGS